MSPVVSNVETKYTVKIIDEKIQGVTIQKTLLTMTDKEGIKVPPPNAGHTGVSVGCFGT